MIILTINDFTEKDTPGLIEIYHNKLNTEFIPQDLSKVSACQVKQMFEKTNQKRLWVIKDQFENLIGQAGIYTYEQTSHIYEVGYIIDYKYSNQGLATRICKMLLDIIFCEYKATKAIARMYQDNKASEKVCLKNNMTLLKKDTLKDQRVRLTYIKKNPLLVKN
ncbi:GNAT family N-acetyltransferase [Myroides sp. LJL119]